MIRLIASDIDGTLKTSDAIMTKQTIDALCQAQSQGLILALASGRSIGGMRHEAQQLQLKQYGGYRIAFNGACVMREADGMILASSQIERDLAQRTIQRALDIGFDICLYDGNINYTNNPTDPRIVADIKTTDLELRPLSIPTNIYKILLVQEPDFIQKHLPDFSQTLDPALRVFASSPYFVEVTLQGVSKGAALTALLKQLHLPAKEVVAFGDQENDLEMLAVAGVGVAVANAVPKVKAMADEMTRSNDEEGVAWWLNTHGII